MNRFATKWVFAVLLAFTGCGLAVVPALASSDAEFQRLIANPDDPVLNRQFAAEAEKRGELRHALAALERARAARPGDREIEAEYNRIRNKMLPPVTAITATAGVSYASNSRQFPSQVTGKHGDVLMDGSIAVEDERTIGGVRWRSRLIGDGQWHWGNTDLSGGQAQIASGPVFALGKDSWIHVAPGASVALIDNHWLYDEVFGEVTFGTVFKGLTQTVTGRVGNRQGNHDIAYSDGWVASVEGRFVLSPSLVSGDYVYIQPRWRMSQSINPLPGSVAGANPSDPSSSLNFERDLSPWSYQEYGGRVSYYWPMLAGKVFLGAGIAVYERDYGNAFVLDPAALAMGVAVSTNQKRNDLYFEPTAHLIFPQLISPNLDFRIDYRFENNTSNDAFREYQDHVVGARVVGRF